MMLGKPPQWYLWSLRNEIEKTPQSKALRLYLKCKMPLLSMPVVIVRGFKTSQIWGILKPQCVSSQALTVIAKENVWLEGEQGLVALGRGTSQGVFGYQQPNHSRCLDCC